MKNKTKKIYIVYGETGEYSDRSDWNVKAFFERKKALVLLNECSEDAKKWEIKRESEYTSPPKDWSKHDPDMKMDYTGTDYFIAEVDLEDKI